MKYLANGQKFVRINLWKYLLLVLGIAFCLASASIANGSFNLLVFGGMMLVVIIILLLCVSSSVRRWKKASIKVVDRGFCYTKIVKMGIGTLPGSLDEMVIHNFNVRDINQIRVKGTGIKVYGDITLRVDTIVNSKTTTKTYKKQEIFVPAYFDEFQDFVSMISNNVA